MRAPSQKWLVGSGTIIILLGLWQYLALNYIDPLFISSPFRIVLAGRDLFWSGEIWPDIIISTKEFFWGYISAICVAIPLGLVIGWYQRAQYLLKPVIDILNTVPRITFLPLFVLWFGIGIASKIAVVFLGAVIPVTIATYSGVKTNERRFVLVARSFCASQLKLFTSIIVPGTIPYIFTGLRYGAGRALLGVVVGEIYASTAGVGHLITEASNTLQTDVMFVGVCLFAGTGLIINMILSRMEHYFDRWRPQEFR
jgi:ABC-type nitrate/sulfonate/bicarbonate transport system permease component